MQDRVWKQGTRNVAPKENVKEQFPVAPLDSATVMQSATTSMTVAEMLKQSTAPERVSPYQTMFLPGYCIVIQHICLNFETFHFFAELATSPMHYMTLRSSPGVPTEAVPITDDGVSPVIRIPVPFPVGASLHSTVYVCEIIAVFLCC